MPTIKESELSVEEFPLCFECNEFEGAIYICGSGTLCERCFADLAGVTEEDLFETDEASSMVDFQVSIEAKTKAKAKLMHEREEDA